MLFWPRGGTRKRRSSIAIRSTHRDFSFQSKISIPRVKGSRVIFLRVPLESCLHHCEPRSARDACFSRAWFHSRNSTMEMNTADVGRKVEICWIYIPYTEWVIGQWISIICNLRYLSGFLIIFLIAWGESNRISFLIGWDSFL